MARTSLLFTAMWLGVGVLVGNAHAQAPADERFVLSGVVFVEGGKGVAWLQEPTFTKNQIVTVRPGDSVGPYRVTRILQHQIELAGPAGTFSVPLAGTAGTPTTGASVTAAAMPPSPEPAGGAMPTATTPPAASPAPYVASPAPAASAPVPTNPAMYPPVPPSVAASHNAETLGSAPAQGYQPPNPAYNNPHAIVIERGDPRREFRGVLFGQQ